MANWVLYLVLIAVVSILSYPFNGRSSYVQKIASRTPSPRSSTVIVPQEKVSVQQSEDTGDWGVAKKVGEHTYTIKVGEDARMTTAQEAVDALNSYRKAHSVGALSVDPKLTEYAQSRADFFKSSGSTDAHAGFSSYLDNEDGFEKLGFARLGENSYYGGPLFGVHVIEWVFGASPEHNANQLDGGWSHVGVGVNGVSVNIIFGSGKL